MMDMNSLKCLHSGNSITSTGLDTELSLNMLNGMMVNNEFEFEISMHMRI